MKWEQVSRSRTLTILFLVVVVAAATQAQIPVVAAAMAVEAAAAATKNVFAKKVELTKARLFWHYFGIFRIITALE